MKNSSPLALRQLLHRAFRALPNITLWSPPAEGTFHPACPPPSARRIDARVRVRRERTIFLNGKIVGTLPDYPPF